ncbi:MAG: response regulator transcription factor, partial [Rhodobacteraceae bacterium]|nr:response regulator transcription factor [Paracoccaceae bacterium]
MQITLLTHDPILANSVALMLASSALGRLSRGGDDVARLARPDVLILDANLPRRLMRALRRRVAEWDGPVPMLLLTGGDKGAAVPNGFETADVLAKPFHQRDLVARIHATQHAADGDIHVGRLSLDTSARHASVDGEKVPLTRMEYEVLEFLATHKGTTLTKE